MILNHDYRRMLRAGYFAEQRVPQKENEAASVVFFCLVFAALIICAVFIQSYNMAGVR